MDPYHRIVPGMPIDTIEGLTRRLVVIEGLLGSLMPKEVTASTPQGAIDMTILGREIGLADIRDFNLRLIPAGVYSDEDGNTSIISSTDAPYIIRFRAGLATHGWPPGTPAEIQASGIDPAVATYDVICRLVGAVGDPTGPGYTPPAPPEE